MDVAEASRTGDYKISPRCCAWSSVSLTSRAEISSSVRSERLSAAQ